MPRSSPEGKSQIEEWVSSLAVPHKKILDIAVGQGTYHTLLSQLENLKDAKWHGIEIWPRWIKKFSLSKKYDYFYESDVRTFDYSSIGTVDIAFAGDVLEHMTKEEAIELVKNVLSVSDNLFISIPIVYMPQGADGGNPYEVHVKPDWSHEEVIATFPQIKESWTGREIGVYWMKNV
jgi:predicted TPR repeat methyltransferase